MRLPVWSKVLFLVVLGVCSSMATSVLMGQMKPEPSPGRRPSAGDAGAAAKQPSQPAARVAEFHLRGMEVNSIGNVMTVQMAAQIFDSRNSISYIWRINVRNEVTKDIVVDRLYEDQIFKIENGPNSNPTFAESLNVPNGNYRVEVTLFEVPLGFDLDRLRDKRTARGQRVVSGEKKVFVGNN